MPIIKVLGKTIRKNCISLHAPVKIIFILTFSPIYFFSEKENDTDDTEDEKSKVEKTDINNNKIVDVESKRKRKAPEKWKKNIRKRKRNSSEQYETARGVEKSGKEFKDFSCYCPLKCSDTVPVEYRKKCFETFYGSGSWEVQTT